MWFIAIAISPLSYHIQYCMILTLVSGGQVHVAQLALVGELLQRVSGDGEACGLVKHGLVDQHGGQVTAGIGLQEGTGTGTGSGVRDERDQYKLKKKKVYK